MDFYKHGAECLMNVHPIADKKKYREPKFVREVYYGDLYVSKDGEVFIELNNELRKTFRVKRVEFKQYLAKSENEYIVYIRLKNDENNKMKKNTYMVKVLVYEAYTGKPVVSNRRNSFEKFQFTIIHKNGDFTDNRFENLELTSVRESNEKKGKNKFTIKMYDEVIKFYITLPKMTKVFFKVYKNDIFEILKGVDPNFNPDLLYYFRNNFNSIKEIITKLMKEKPLSKSDKGYLAIIRELNKNDTLAKFIKYLQRREEYMEKFENYLEENMTHNLLPKTMMKDLGKDFVLEGFGSIERFNEYVKYRTQSIEIK